MNSLLFDSLIDLAIREDIGEGDHTTKACIPIDAKGKAVLFSKEQGVIAGVSVTERILKKTDSGLNIQIFQNDGQEVMPETKILSLDGHIHTILTNERLILNIMQRMSGIATNTRKYAESLSGLHTKLLDTRKTTPGFRVFEKEAVRIGGGNNYRFGLYDMIMIKDNHIDFAGGIKNAIQSVLDYLQNNNLDLKITIEARTLEDVKEILFQGNINRIMLDNFTVSETGEAVKIINNQFETESSGGITLQNIRKYAETGVDYISAGALTHHIKSLDLSLKTG